MTNCLYTVATDAAGQREFTLMAKILVASQLRNFFAGEIFVFHNAEAPLFRVERKGLTEVMLPPSFDDGKRLKYKVRQWIEADRYDWVCFLDCDMLAQRNIDHLLDPDIPADLLWQPEGKMTQDAFNSYFHDHEFPKLWRHGANSGSFAVRGKFFHQVMEEWERIDQSEPVRPKILVDQPAWNRILFDTELRTRPFEKGEIMFPLLHDHDYRKWREAALIHANGASPEVKLEFLLSQYLGRTIGDAKTALALFDM
jgi:hypothetical protein